MFFRLGCTSFGGPVAHLAYFHGELVTKRKWLDDAHYSDLVALCQFLPGPASSQVAFALGMHRAGFGGAVAASLCFTLPSAVLMLLFAAGLSQLDVSETGWVHGMKVAAVAVVAQAVWAMGRKLCPDRQRVSLCLTAAATLLVWSGALVQVSVIAFGGAVGFLLYRNGPGSPPDRQDIRGHRAAVAALATFGLLLLLLPVAAAQGGSLLVSLFDRFYRAGALVFGGGHVVLPLLRAELVPTGLLSDDQFLAGYGLAQAMPGPLFSFSAYLGAAIGGQVDWAIGVWCLIALFLPGWLLIGGALPFWHYLRSLDWVKSSLAGTNAAVVGVLLAALYTPVFSEGIRGSQDLAIAALGFLLLEHWKWPAWSIVGGAAAWGYCFA